VFFREVLKEGRSLIVVRAESPETATVACGILDSVGLGIQGRTPVKMQTATRQTGDVAIVDVSGRITLGEGNVMLREVVREPCPLEIAKLDSTYRQSLEFQCGRESTPLEEVARRQHSTNGATLKWEG
jgi:hypothetical protein